MIKNLGDYGKRYTATERLLKSALQTETLINAHDKTKLGVYWAFANTRLDIASILKRNTRIIPL